MLDGDQLIRALERITETEVELVLAGRHLGVAGLDGDAEVVEPVDDLLPDFAAHVDRMIEVTGPVMPSWTRPPGRVSVQEKEFQLDRDRVIEDQRPRCRQHTGEDAARGP